MNWGYSKKKNQAYVKKPRICITNITASMKTSGKSLLAQRRVIRNRTKRPKIGSHGLKTYKNTKVYIAKETEGGWQRAGKPAPREEIVDVFRDMWNNDPSIKRLRKHVRDISIRRASTLKHVGLWDNEKQKVTVIDDGNMTPNDIRSLIVHELIGHAFWDQARKWRRDELIEFNKIANEMPPVNSYVAENEEKWRQWNDDSDEFKKHDEKFGEWNESEEAYNDYQRVLELHKQNGHDTMTRYANEQHSAVTEIIYGDDYHKRLIGEDKLEKLIDAWKRLHY